MKEKRLVEASPTLEELNGSCIKTVDATRNICDLAENKIQEKEEKHRKEKQKCPICMRKKNNINVLDPCLHKVCYDCLSFWVSMNGTACPICRTKINSTFGEEKSGELVVKIRVKEMPKIGKKYFEKPKGVDHWQRNLALKWDKVPEFVWSLLCSYGIEDIVMFSMVMRILSESTKEKAQKEITKCIGKIGPSFCFKLHKMCCDNMNPPN